MTVIPQWLSRHFSKQEAIKQNEIRGRSVNMDKLVRGGNNFDYCICISDDVMKVANLKHIEKFKVLFPKKYIYKVKKNGVGKFYYFYDSATFKYSGYCGKEAFKKYFATGLRAMRWMDQQK